jgi:RiboL-PSP-HEPN
MDEGKSRILNVLSTFTGRDGEPKNDNELYILKAMWLMMLSEFEASIKQKAEKYIDEIKKKDISDIHICLLVRHFHGGIEDELTITKIVSFYKKNPKDISYRHFTQDRVPKYKTKAVEKLFNNMGIFFTPEEHSLLSVLDSVASTRDSIAHGDIGVEITRKQLEDQIQHLSRLLKMIETKLS